MLGKQTINLNMYMNSQIPMIEKIINKASKTILTTNTTSLHTMQ